MDLGLRGLGSRGLGLAVQEFSVWGLRHPDLGSPSNGASNGKQNGNCYLGFTV